MFTTPSAADTKMWLALWLWNTTSQQIIYCISHVEEEEDKLTAADISVTSQHDTNTVATDTRFLSLWRGSSSGRRPQTSQTLSDSAVSVLTCLRPTNEGLKELWRDSDHRWSFYLIRRFDGTRTRPGTRLRPGQTSNQSNWVSDCLRHRASALIMWSLRGNGRLTVTKMKKKFWRELKDFCF